MPNIVRARRQRAKTIALRVARWTLSLLLLAVLLAGLAIGLVALALWLAPGWLHVDSPLALAVFFVLAALLATPLQLLLRRLIDRVLFREQVGFRQVVHEFGSSLAQVIDLPELSHLILSRIVEVLQLDAASLYLFDPFSGTYTLYEALAGVQTQDAPVFAETDRFVAALRAAHGAVYRFDRATTWLRELPAEEQERVNRLRGIVFLPLSTKGPLAGWINLGARLSGERYSVADLDLLDALADRAAVAIENARLFAERERRLTELAVLNEIGQAINSARSLPQVLETIYRETGRLMDTSNFYIALYDAQQEEVSFPLYIEDGQRQGAQARRRGNGLTEYLLRTQQPLLIAERVEDKVRELGLEVIGPPAHSWLGVPIVHEGQAVGVIAVQNHDPGCPYDVQDLTILSTIANQAAIAIENARLYEMTDQALSQRLQEMTVLADFARTLADVALDPAQIAEQTLARAVETLRAEMGILAHHNPSSQDFVPLAQHRWPGGEGLAEQWHALLPELLAVGHSSLLLLPDSPAAAAMPMAAPAAHILCPLVREDALLAILHLVLPPQAETDENRRRFLRHLADHAAIALENALLYRQQVEQRQVLDRRARHLAEILNLSIAIRANMELDQVLRLVVEAVRDALGFGVALLSVLDEEEPTRLRRVAAIGLDAETLGRIQAERPPLAFYEMMMRPECRVGLCYLVRSDDATIWQHIRSYQGSYSPPLVLHECPEWRDPCTLLVPLRGSGDRLVGILSLGSPPGGVVPDRTTLEMVEILANQAAVAVENTRLYQALREAYETKGEFLTLVAQQLQVPMGTIWGYAELLDQDSAHVDLNTLRGFLRVLKTNITRLEAVIHDLLEVSRIEARAFRLLRVRLDASEVILDSVATFRPQIERKGLTLAVDVPSGLPPALADRDRLSQVIDNLLSNACKYTLAPGTISVSLSSVQSPQDPARPGAQALRYPCLLIRVQDSGIGISRADQRRLFTRFFRADHPVVRQEVGTGLGLYLVRLLVEALDGQVWVESELGQGSAFYVALPAAS